jgi:hypothetical protein
VARAQNSPTPKINTPVPRHVLEWMPKTRVPRPAHVTMPPAVALTFDAVFADTVTV